VTPLEAGGSFLGSSGLSPGKTGAYCEKGAILAKKQKRPSFPTAFFTL
jgi:hypothetical protein